MSDEIVTVIVPVYNVELYLDDCIGSIVGQTYKNLKIILVNDGSIDNSLAICNAWAKKDSRITVISKKNKGVSSARNVGLDYAVGKYVLFIDSDDIIDLSAIENMVSLNRDGTIVGMMIDYFSGNVNAHSYSGNLYISFRELMDLRKGYFCCGILYDFTIITQNGLRFSESLVNLEDVVWNVTYGMYVDHAILTYDAYYNYRMRAGSITSNCVNKKWQIQCWLKAIDSLERISIPKRNTKYYCKELRRCKNNVYAELFAAHMTWEDFVSISAENSCRKKFSSIEFFIFRLLLRIRNTIK